MPYTFLEHTSDIKILVRAKDLKSLFRESLRATFEIITGEDISSLLGRKSKSVREVNISSADRETILADFLSEALSLSEIHKEFYFDCEFREFGHEFISAYLFGLPLVKKVEEIKGVSYHDLRITTGKDGQQQAIILFDV